MDPERLQVVGLCARNHFDVVDLFHSFQLELDRRLGDARLSPHTGATSTEAERRPDKQTRQQEFREAETNKQKLKMKDLNNYIEKQDSLYAPTSIIT